MIKNISLYIPGALLGFLFVTAAIYNTGFVADAVYESLDGWRHAAFIGVVVELGLLIVGFVLTGSVVGKATSWLHRTQSPELYLGLDPDEDPDGWEYISPAPLSVFALKTFQGGPIWGRNLGGAHLCFFKTFHCCFVDHRQYTLSLDTDEGDNAPFYEDEEGNPNLTFTVTDNATSGHAVFMVHQDKTSPDDTTQMDEELDEEQLNTLRAEIQRSAFSRGSLPDEISGLSEEDLDVTDICVEPFGNTKALMYRCRVMEIFEIVSIYLTVGDDSYEISFTSPIGGDAAFVDFLENFYRSISVGGSGYLGQLSILSRGFLT